MWAIHPGTRDPLIEEISKIQKIKKITFFEKLSFDLFKILETFFEENIGPGTHRFKKKMLEKE